MKNEKTFSELLSKSIQAKKVKCYKDANKHLVGFSEARKKVLSILDSQKNKKDGYFKEFAENFIIKIQEQKFYVDNTQKEGFVIADNISKKVLYLSSMTSSKSITISIAELINNFINNNVKFYTYKNTPFGDIFSQIN